jgi:hypothetical protein
MGLTTEEWVKQTMGGYAKLALEDRLDAVKNLTEAGYSQQLTAEIIGVRAGKEASTKAQNEATAAKVIPFPVKRYGTIVIDPPWEMEKIKRDVRPNQVAFDYPTMTEAELEAFDVKGMAEDAPVPFGYTTVTAALRAMW